MIDSSTIGWHHSISRGRGWRIFEITNFGRILREIKKHTSGTVLYKHVTKSKFFTERPSRVEINNLSATKTPAPWRLNGGPLATLIVSSVTVRVLLQF